MWKQTVTMSNNFSIIIPVFNEAKGLVHLAEKIDAVLSRPEYAYDLIFIDDGSRDATWQTLRTLCQSSPHIKAVRFSRNFGKEAAIHAGLRLVQGEAAVIMDADLQHPPELLPLMLSLWKNEGYEVVEGVKTVRQKETFLNKIGSAFFFRVLRTATGFDIRRHTDFKLLGRKAIDLYLSLSEKERFFRMLVPSFGLKTVEVPFSPDKRIGGAVSFSLMKRLRLAVTAVTSFSSLPLHLVTLLGFITLAFSTVLGIQTLYIKISGKAVEGFTTVILIVLLIGSILMIALGIIGEYLARIFEEIKNRPAFVISEILKNEKSNTNISP